MYRGTDRGMTRNASLNRVKLAPKELQGDKDPKENL